MRMPYHVLTIVPMASSAFRPRIPPLLFSQRRLLRVLAKTSTESISCLGCPLLELV